MLAIKPRACNWPTDETSDVQWKVKEGQRNPSKRFKKILSSTRRCRFDQVFRPGSKCFYIIRPLWIRHLDTLDISRREGSAGALNAEPFPCRRWLWDFQKLQHQLLIFLVVHVCVSEMIWEWMTSYTRYLFSARAAQCVCVVVTFGFSVSALTHNRRLPTYFLWNHSGNKVYIQAAKGLQEPLRTNTFFFFEEPKTNHDNHLWLTQYQW